MGEGRVRGVVEKRRDVFMRFGKVESKMALGNLLAARYVSLT
jgi:hypothetical protein